MKYERLTKKICGYYHGKRFVGGKGVINDGKYYRGCFDATAIVDRLGELEDKIERGELIPAAEYESARHRAEVAEQALLLACANVVKDEEDNVNMELLARVVYTHYLRKAEKELAELKGEKE